MRCCFRKTSKILICSAILTCMILVLLQDFDNAVLEEKTSFGQGQNGRRGPHQRPVDLLDNEVSILHRNAMAIASDKEKYSNTHVETQRKPQHRKTELSDIFIAIKTTKKYHTDRLQLLLDTWIALARDQTYIFTDDNDEAINKQMPDGHLINTNCSNSHYRKGLSCKMAVEYDFYMDSEKRWFCHVDDDTYLNVPQLLELLRRYNHTDDWYLGKPSLKHPIEVQLKSNLERKVAFWFATGGAGFCISWSLALKMMPHAGGGRFMTTAESIRLPDDCTIGYIINHLLRKELTVINTLHSHLEALWRLRKIEKQVTLSYASSNVVEVRGFNNSHDPTRLLTVHCHLFPNFKYCSEMLLGRTAVQL